MGEWNNDPNISTLGEKFKSDIKYFDTYSDTYVNFVDTSELKRLCDESDNEIETTFEYIETLSPAQVDGGQQFCGYCRQG
ncbi:hypothetical protein FACS1894208_12650 [Clostridia bacterium]|nr:hypothetical protein FACS1894208_12650 [Clostridia bacterium]